MTVEEQIDNILLALQNLKSPDFPSTIKQDLKFEISDKDLELILRNLLDEGYASLNNGKQGGHIRDDVRLYDITYKGKLFLSNGGYQMAKRDKIRSRRWQIMKLVVTVFYSVLVLLVAAWGVIVAQNGNQKDKQMEEAKVQNEKLKAKLLEQENITNKYNNYDSVRGKHN